MKFPIAIAVVLFSCLVAVAFGDTISRTLTINVTPASAGPCSNAPPAAKRAGYTTMAYCLDGSNPKYADVANWFDCKGVGNFDPNWLQHYEWQPQELIPHICDFFHQVQDPLTGRTVLAQIWNNEYPGNDTSSTAAWVRMNAGIAGYNNGNFTGETLPQHSFPTGYYMELRVHDTFNGMTSWPFGGNPVPDFFTWGYNQGTTGSCWINGGSGPCALEHDLYETEISLESYHSGAIHDWGDCDSSGSCGGNWGWVYFGGGPNFADDHTYGVLSTSDGSTAASGTLQSCWYVDNVLTNNGGQVPCFTTTNAGVASGHIGANSPVGDRQLLTWWMGGPAALDTALCQSVQACVDQGGVPGYNIYIDHFAIWSCANWQTDNICKANGLTQ